MSSHPSSNKDLDFEKIYTMYYPKLVRFSKEYVLTRADAENIVQDIFVHLWEKRNTLDKIQSINAFLFRLVKNKCVDFLRHKITIEVKQCDMQEVLLKEYNFKLYSIELFDDTSLSDAEIEHIIHTAIENLPEKCREIFILSKIEGLKYHEIAEKMQLSPNTVRNQIVIALKKMKDELKEYLPLFIFLTM